MNLAKQASMVMLHQSTLVLQNKILSRVYLHGFDLLITIAAGDAPRTDISRNLVLVSPSTVGRRHRDLVTWEYSKQSLKVNWRP